jgi:hypothetical protein
MWRDKNGLSFRIEDEETTLNMSFSGRDPFLRRFAATLSRSDGKPDSFEGNALAQFSAGIPGYSHRVTATLDESGQLQLECPEWPGRTGHGTKSLKAVLMRQGESPQSLPGRSSHRAGSAARARQGP